jgi:type I restriction enzyme, S subunit
VTSTSLGSAHDVVLKDLLVTTKDGDWGRSEPTSGYLPYRVIRGTDFPHVRVGDISTVPLRYLPEHTVSRRTLQSGDILIETAGGTQDRPTGRTLLITERILEQLDSPVTCASFARFLRVDKDLADPGYVYWFLQNLYLSGEMDQHQVRHTGVARFQYTWFAQTQQIPLPPRAVQQGIAATLGVLEAKILSNRRMRVLMRQIGAAQLQVAILSDGYQARLRDVTTSIARGVAPAYADNDLDAAVVLNQKCIRDGWVDLSFARRMIVRDVAFEKLLQVAMCW